MMRLNSLEVWVLCCLVIKYSTAFIIPVPSRPLARQNTWQKITIEGTVLRTKRDEESDAIASQDATEVATSSKNPEEILSEERRANLFQFLLRDLQVEGVPLLSVDANQVHTLQAAMWTTMAELLVNWKQHKGNQKEKACLIFEEIPIDALRAFVEDFRILQTDERLMEQLPELSRFQVSLVGKGVGPAILLKLARIKRSGGEGKMEEKSDKNHNSIDGFLDDTYKNHETHQEFDSNRIVAAMKVFIDRMVAEDEIGLVQEKTLYRVCTFNDVCHVLSSFWNCICELQSVPSDQVSSIILALPSITEMKTTQDNDGYFVTGPKQQHDRFAVVTELISRSLCLYRGDDVFDLEHYYPKYTREQIFPIDQPAFGHLPPKQWIQPILNHCNIDKTLSDDEKDLTNYLRRSPVPAVMIKRVALMDEQAATDKDAAVSDLDLGYDKVSVMGIPYEARRIVRVIETGKETLKAKQEEEIRVAKDI